MKEYKVESFICVFTAVKRVEQTIQEYVDKYSKQGWTLHSFQIPGNTGDFCIMIFEREASSIDDMDSVIKG